MPVLMPNPVFRWFVPAQNGTGLVPAAGYIAAFYEPGTTTPKTIYEPDGTPYPSPANEAVLNSEGYAEIWLGEGSYKLRVLDPDRGEIYTLDNISGSSSFSSGFLDTVIATDDPPTNGLAQYDTANRFVWCAGYYAVGDGGHGFFWNDVSSDPDDGGYTIASTFDATRDWFRVPDEDGAVRAASFGYIGTKTGNLTSQLQAGCSYAYSHGKKILIGAGSVATVGSGSPTLSLYAPEFYLEPGSMFTSNGTMTEVLFNGIVTGSREQHFTGCGYAFETLQVDDHPEWVGGYPTGSGAGNAAAFALWFASDAGAYILGPGTWETSTAPPWPAGSPVLLFGSISVADGPDFPTGCYFPDDSRFRLGSILFPGGASLSGSGADVVASEDLEAVDLRAAGNVSAVGSVSAVGNVISGADVIAEANTSNVTFKAAGQYQHIEDDASTSGTGATNLLSTIIAANTLFNDGDLLRIRLSGTSSSGSSQAKNITVTVGGTTICTLTLTFQTEDWQVEIDAWMSSGGLYCNTKMFSATSVISDIVNTAAIGFTVDRTLQCVGTASVTGTITQKMLAVQFYPANGRN